MALNFKVYQSAVVLGVVRDIIGDGGTLRFTRPSLNDETKRLCVVLALSDGTSDTATCSETVTVGLRKALKAGESKKRCLASLLGLQVLEGKNGGNYISSPMGADNQEESFTVESLKAEVVSWESLAAL